MLEKNSKISVLRTMIGLGEEIEPHFIVPQNSVSNFRQKMGISERTTATSGTASTMPSPLIPLENSIRSTQPATTKCPHCENMAKNFLYLESLIRSNYSPKSQCGLCYSSLKYLQYVNKNIMQVFGNFDSIVQAAKAFSATQKRKPINGDASNSINSAHKIKNAHSAIHQLASRKAPGKSFSKHRLSRTRSKAGKLSAKRSKFTAINKSVSSFRLTGGSANKPQKVRSRNSAKKGKKAKLHNTNGNSPSKGKQIKALRNKANIVIRGLKQKNIKSKRNKVPMARVTK